MQQVQQPIALELPECPLPQSPLTEQPLPESPLPEQPLKPAPDLPHARKCQQLCTRVSKLKLSLLVQIIRTGVYLLVAFGLFVFFQRSSRITLHEENYFSSEQVVYPSEIRGLFPPMQGYANRLLGKWRVSFTNSLEIGTNDIYRNYTVEFKTSDNLRIKRIGCDGDFIMKWETFQFNLFISDYRGGVDSEMVINPDEYDRECIEKDSHFFQHLRSASVWTLYEDRLYILVEKWSQNRNVQSILLLERQ